jgi:hypothetical protein
MRRQQRDSVLITTLDGDDRALTASRTEAEA